MLTDYMIKKKKKNRERLEKKAQERYLSEEEKNKCHFARELYRNFSEEEKNKKHQYTRK